MPDVTEVTLPGPLTAPHAGDLRDALAAALDRGCGDLLCPPGEEADCTGLQLIAAAVVSARARGLPCRVVLPEGSPAADLWQRLGLDALPESHLSAAEEPEAAPSPAADEASQP